MPTPSSIRLLRRLSKTSDGLLSYALDVVDFEDRPEYHYFSYTWGSPHANGNLFREDFDRVVSEYGVVNLKPIRVNRKSLGVRQNLHDALCELPTSGWVGGLLNRPDLETTRTKLQDAAEGRAALIHSYILDGANIHALCHLGNSPLHYAASEGHLDVWRCWYKQDPISAELTKSKTLRRISLSNITTQS